MSQENVELVRRGMASADAFWSMFDDHVVLIMNGVVLDADDVYVGREAAIELTRQYWGTFENYRLVPVELIDVGPSVVVVVHESGRGRGSGAPFERRWVQVWTFRGRRIIHWEVFWDRAEALEAVGLSEQDAHADS